MRPTLFTLSALLALAPLAHASAIDDFSLVGNGETVNFALPATETFLNYPGIVYLRYTAPGTVNGIAGYTINATFFAWPDPLVGTAVISFVASDPYGQRFDGPSPIGVTYTPPPPPPPFINQYGTLTNTFVPSTYDLFSYDLIHITGIPIPYTLTITPEATTTPGATITPEPASLLLLATGSLGLFGALRRR